MKTAMIAGLAAVLLAPMGAPAGFTVDAAEVQVRRTGESATLRIAYDVTINNTACGWFNAEFEGLPEGDKGPKATLVLDGKEFATIAEGTGSFRAFRAFREEKEEGRRALDAAKSIRLLLDYPESAWTGPEWTVAVPMPRSYDHSGERKEAAKKGFPRLGVRLEAEVEKASSEVRTTFKGVEAGAKVLLRADARSAGVTLLPY